MSLAEKIEAVLHYIGINSEECPVNLLDDVTDIKCRYSELKLTKDFEDAARLARVEWIQEQLTEFNREVSKFNRDLREDN